MTLPKIQVVKQLTVYFISRKKRGTCCQWKKLSRNYINLLFDLIVKMPKTRRILSSDESKLLRGSFKSSKRQILVSLTKHFMH